MASCLKGVTTMNSSYWSVKYEVAERCKAMHLPHQLALLFEREVNKWLKGSGELWTVNRLKSLKTDLIRQQGGLPMLTWVKKNRFGQTAGVIGSMFRFSQKGPKQFLAVLNSLMAYSALKPGKPTEKHIESLHQNLNAKPVAVFHIPVSVRVPDIQIEELTPFIFYSGCPSKSAPLFPKGSTEQSGDLQWETRWLQGKGNRDFFLRHFSLYEPCFRGLATPLEIIDNLFEAGNCLTDYRDGIPEEFSYSSWEVSMRSCLFPPVSSDSIVSAGRIAGLDKDGGWKMRWVANPHRIHQHVLEPFKQRLLNLCHKLPWDCTHDQSKAVPAIQDRLKNGGQVHSVDLSSATDLFPLNFQEYVLRELNTSHRWQQYVDLFIELSRSQWKFGDSWVSWKKGQPMGLGPSFPSFALSHGLLLNFLAGHRPGLFFILGDDVVILDDEVYNYYVRVLETWEVPISTSKSLSSTKVAEFGGSVITADYVFPMYKWKNIDDENFLAMMKLFGKGFSSLITRRQRVVYETVKSLQPPWGCNHEVTDLQKSRQDTAEFFEHLREPVSSTCWSFLRWFKSHKGLSGAVSRSIKTLKQVQSAFDEKVKTAMSGTLFPRCSYPEGVRSHFTAMRVDTHLPSLNYVANKESTLELYERILATSSKPPYDQIISALGSTDQQDILLASLPVSQYELKFKALIPRILEILKKRVG
jgi:hypothetical protein